MFLDTSFPNLRIRSLNFSPKFAPLKKTVSGYQASKYVNNKKKCYMQYLPIIMQIKISKAIKCFNFEIFFIISFEIGNL